MDEFYQCLRLCQKEKPTGFKCTGGITLGKVTNIVKNKMNKRLLSRKQSKKKPRRVGH